MRKGIVLAGGKGTRLQPITQTQNKHLVGVLNYPMILFPIHTLKQMGIKNVMIVSGGEHMGGFAEFLQDGSQYGMNFTYRVQREAGGIVDALLLAEEFVGDSRFATILGDNFFSDITKMKIPKEGNAIFVKRVSDPQRFGVYNDKKKKIIEKPKMIGEGEAVTGLYVYEPIVFDLGKGLTPSDRGELEVSDLNNLLLDKEALEVLRLTCFWSDMGTPESLYRTTKYVKSSPQYRKFKM